MSSGVTNYMRNIRRPAPEWVHLHIHPTTRMRKAARQRRIRSLTNIPYVNPARDGKRRARLRKDL